MTEITPYEQTFDAIASALMPLEPGESVAILVYMTALVTTKYNPGVPAAGLKAKLADMIGVAIDAQAELAAKVGLAVDGLVGDGTGWAGFADSQVAG